MSLAKNVDFNSVRTRQLSVDQLSAETQLDLPVIDIILTPVGPVGSIGIANDIVYVSDGSNWIRANAQDLESTLQIGNSSPVGITLTSAAPLQLVNAGESASMFMGANLVVASSTALDINTADGVNLVSATKLAVPYAQSVLKGDFAPVTLDAMSGRVNYALGTSIGAGATETQTINCAALLSNTSVVHVTSRNERISCAPTTVAPGQFIVSMYNSSAGALSADFMFTIINNS